MAIPLSGKILLDTNVFIDYLRTGLHEQWVWGRGAIRVRFLSAVVLLELRIGADTPRRRRAVDRIEAAFPAERVLAPTAVLWSRAGHLFRLLHREGRDLADRLGPLNDILIALTAWLVGATVVTANLSEFHRIAARLPGLSVVEPSVEASP